jgi:ABC-type Fe3+-siderophore transport system permease subunit
MTNPHIATMDFDLNINSCIIVHPFAFVVILTITSLLCAGNHGIVWILLGSFLGAFIIVLIIAFLAWKKGILRREKQSKSFIG